jgi:M6 family metalloprotease-like protein
MRRLVPFVTACLLGALPTAARGDYMDHFVVREDVGPRKSPYLGRSKLLLIPVEVAGAAPLDLEAIGRFFSPEDPDGFVAYYRTASLGRYLPEVTVAPLVRFDSCPLPAAQFPDCKVQRGDITAFTAGMDMIRDIVRLTDQAGVDFSEFDVNGKKGAKDGFADGVMILTNVPFGGLAFPFAYFNRDDNLAGGTGGPLVVDGTRITHVAIAGKSNLQVMVHEFGHLLGLTDLYDEGRTYDGLHLSFMGSWGYDPKIPLPDAETRYRLRWANLVQVNGSGRHRIGPVESSGEVYRLGSGGEYFLVENRGPGGQFDGEFTHRGLVVYHVDRTVKLRGEEGRFVDRILDCVNCDPWRPYIRIVEADGRFDLAAGKRPDYAADLFRDGSTFGPNPTGTPLSALYQVQSSNLYSGAVTNIGIRDIVVREDGVIEATFDAPPTDPCAQALCEDGEGCGAVNCGGPPPGEVQGCGCGAGGLGAPFALALGLGLLSGATARARRRRRDFTSS